MLTTVPPEMPQSIRLIGISEDTVTIEWSEPRENGGAPITNYIIEKREGRSPYWTPVATVGSRVTSYVIQYLQPSCTYYIRVAAENEEGVGAFKELCEAVRPMKPKSKQDIMPAWNPSCAAKKETL